MKAHPKEPAARKRKNPLAAGRTHPDAVAWQEWLYSDEGKRCAYGETSGQYLENRLWHAFMAGRKGKP